MKIIYVTTISSTVNAFLLPHIKMLMDESHQVDIACNVTDDINSELCKIGCKIFDIEFQRSPIRKENYSAYKKIKKLMMEREYDLVHTHTPIASFIVRMACRNISNLQILYTAHGFHFFKGAPLKNWLIYYPLERIAARWSDGIITINDEDYYSAMDMKLRNKDSVFKLNGVGIDLNRFSPHNLNEKLRLRSQYGFNCEDYILICVAELNQNKHQDLLINAVNIIKDRISNVKLLLVGRGQLMEQYQNQVRSLALENHVHFMGYRKDIPNILKLSDILISTSKREGLPVNIMEAMATGLPIIVTDCRGNRDLIKDDQTGYIVGINDVQGLADAIDKIYSSDEIPGLLKIRCLEDIKQYSIEKVLNDIKEIYSHYYNKYD